MLSEKLPVDEPVAAPHAHRLISAADVRDLFAGVSDMTIWRWLQDEALGFPKPIYVQRRRFWREAEITAFIETRGQHHADS